MDIFNYITITEDSRIPKYKQIVDAIINNISIGNLKMGEKIPSINMFSEEYLLSRDTVDKAYNILKERKVIQSIRGKGYYVTRTKLISKVNILFLINKLSSYKMRIGSRIQPEGYRWRRNPFGEPIEVTAVRIEVEAASLGWSGRTSFELPVRTHRGRLSPEPRLVDRRGAKRRPLRPGAAAPQSSPGHG